jgi:hypothetical protein
VNVSIKYGPRTQAAVVIDGMDITHAVLADGFGVEFPQATDDKGAAIVRLRLRPDVLTIDLPEGIVVAEIEDGEVA